MIKAIFSILIFSSILQAHPVSYTIELTATYNKDKKEVLVTCQSNSRNKCGLHGIHFLNKDKKIIASGKFPFLKEKVSIKSKEKPETMEFYLRNIPEHKYIIYVK